KTISTRLSDHSLALDGSKTHGRKYPQVTGIANSSATHKIRTFRGIASDPQICSASSNHPLGRPCVARLTTLSTCARPTAKRDMQTRKPTSQIAVTTDSILLTIGFSIVTFTTIAGRFSKAEIAVPPETRVAGPASMWLATCQSGSSTPNSGSGNEP